MKKLYKQFLIPSLFLISTFLTFYWLSTLFFKKEQFFLSDFILFLFFLFLMAGFFIFSVLVLSKSAWQILLYFLASCGIFIFFGFNLWIKIAGFSFFLFLLLGSWLAQRERDILLRFSFSRISKNGIKNLFSGMAICIAILAFLSPKIIGGKLTLPPFLFNLLWPSIEKILPGISTETTVDEFLIFQSQQFQKEIGIPENEGGLFQEIMSQLFPFSLEKLEPGLSKELTEKRLKEEEAKTSEEFLKLQKQELSKMVGRELKGDEKIKDLFYEMISAQISRVIKPYQTIGAIAVIFIFFSIIKVLLNIYLFICFPFFWLLFIILKRVGLFKTKTEKVDREEIAI